MQGLLVVSAVEAQIQVQQRDSLDFLHALGAKCLCETQGVWQGAEWDGDGELGHFLVLL